MSNSQMIENINLQKQVFILKVSVIFLFILVLISFFFNCYALGKINGYIHGMEHGMEQGQISTQDPAPIFHK